MARYDVAGRLDPSFGGGGTVTTPMSQFSTEQEGALAVAIQGDGRIVAAGYCQSNIFCLARYNADGSLDLSFGGDGKVTTGFTGGDSANAVAVQADGKIVAAGYCLGDHTDSVFCLARYTSTAAWMPALPATGQSRLP